MSHLFFLVTVLSALFLHVSPFAVAGPSMEPTLHSGQFFLVWQMDSAALKQSLKHGDIVVFTLADDPDYFYVKRVIGLPGDRVQIREEGVYLLDENGNGQRLEEPYLPDGVSSVPVTGRYREYFRQTFAVPQESIFVMGDNREYSLDSRLFQSPFVPLVQVKGVMIVPDIH